MSHAPQVLEKARDLIDRKRAEAAPQPMATPNASTGDVPSLGELKNRLFTTNMQLDELQSKQHQLTQTVAELAEQNAELVSAVSALRQTLRLMVGGLVLAFVGLGALAYSHFL